MIKLQALIVFFVLLIYYPSQSCSDVSCILSVNLSFQTAVLLLFVIQPITFIRYATLLKPITNILLFFIILFEAAILYFLQVIEWIPLPILMLNLLISIRISKEYEKQYFKTTHRYLFTILIKLLIFVFTLSKNGSTYILRKLREVYISEKS